LDVRRGGGVGRGETEDETVNEERCKFSEDVT